MVAVTIGDVELQVADEGTGHPLLLVHGFPLDHQMWQGQLASLASACRVIAPDLRGFGRSGVTPGTVSMARFADDLACLLDALRITQPVTLAGLSMGGYIAWQFWQRHAERLERLVLCDTRARADTAEESATRLRTAEQVLADGPAVLVPALIPRLFSETSRRDRRSVVAATEQVIRSAPAEGVAAALRGMAGRPDVTDRLGAIGVPTLLICGAEDVITGPREMEKIAGAIPGSALVTIPGCGHMAPLEDPAAVNHALRAFMGLPPGTAS